MSVADFELKVLRYLNGDEGVSVPAGSSVNAACSYLKGRGFVSSPPYEITKKGEEFLTRPGIVARINR